MEVIPLLVEGEIEILGRIEESARGSLVSFRQHQDELLTAETAEEVPWPAGGKAQRLADAFQAIVALDMAVMVVELLEVIDIQQDQ